MNIGIFTDTYKPQINGIVTSVSILEKELRKMGHKVFIFTASDPNLKHKTPGVFRIPSFPFVFLPTCRFAFYYPPKLLLKLKKLKLDVIHTQTEFPLGIFGFLVSQFYRLPRVHTYHTMYEDYTHYVANGHLLSPEFARKYSRIFCNGSWIVVAPTEKARTSLLSYGVKRPVKVIPTGFDFSKFSDSSDAEDEINRIKSNLGIAAGAPVLVTICRIAKEKSIDMIISKLPELIQKLPGLKFVIVGSGPYRDELTNLCETLNVSSSVIFAGPKPWDEIANYYRLGNLFVSASVTETQGLTYMEAMASRVPVAARYDPSIEQIITDGKTGYTFEEENCADVLYKALTSDNTKLVENAWHNIQIFSAENFAREIESVYTEAIETKPRKWYKIRMPRIFTKMAAFVVDLKKPELIELKFQEDNENKQR